MDADGALALLGASREFTDALEATMLGELESAPQPLSLRELIDRIAPQLGQWQPATFDLLAHPLLGHLEEATARGQLDLQPGPPARWRVANAGPSARDEA